MKKLFVILLITIVSVAMVFSLCGCRALQQSIREQVENIDGYYVWEHDKDNYCFLGAEQDKIIDGCLTIPDKIGNLSVRHVGAERPVFGDDRLNMLENDEIKKIVINHHVGIYSNAFFDLNQLVEVEITDGYLWEWSLNSNSLLSISLTDCFYYGEITESTQLRCIKAKDNRSSVEISHPENIVAFYITDTSRLPERFFDDYNSLSSLIITEAISEINDDAFKNSNIDVFVRLDEETFKQKLNNGWDKGVNVEWGFKDEIIVFDSMFGSEIKNESTQKNYLKVKLGEKITPPTPPTRDGYVFLGWYKDYRLSEQWNFETDVVEDSTVLVAGWQKI